jgi:hypothetical protein
MIWHELYSSTNRTHEPEKAQKDLIQVVTLAVLLVEQDSAILEESYHETPEPLRAATPKRMPGIQALLSQHPQVHAAFAALPKADAPLATQGSPSIRLVPSPWGRGGRWRRRRVGYGHRHWR